MLCLAGCAGLPPEGAGTGAAPPRPPLQQVTTFALLGRIAVHHGDSSYSARVSWRHEPARDAILVSSPLGQGIAEVVRDAGGARLTLADRREFAAADWEELSERVFGVRLPLADLPRWVLGDVAGNAAGWQVEVLQREDSPANPLPTLLELRREDTAVRLKIDEWSEVR
ncbi:MAG TPA: outer membrane lipoprotein LolB [Rhodocyclaceae bacterium]|nr:outer membrane lipoprotein LolB [Rhodocyclaceae bacterium]